MSGGGNTTPWEGGGLGPLRALPAYRGLRRAPDGDRGDNARGHLHFTFGPTRRDPFKVQVQLDPSDSYTVRLVRCLLGTGQVETLEEVSDVYCDMLGEVLVGMEGRHLCG